ncbi:MAG: tRNA adenosine(34) deaminase TadA [Pyrinomonadaceae bacterium]
MTEIDELWMTESLRSAQQALELDEVPVGACLIDRHGELIASGYNQTITTNDPTAHAEIVVLRAASARLGNYRLLGTTMYTTIEPCVMCAGALVNARVERLVYGARDERFGAVETQFRLCDSDLLNHRMTITSGVMGENCRKLIQDFFRTRR